MPIRHRSVADYLAALSAERRAEVERMRELAISAHPRLDETIKWNSPNFSLDGADRFTVNASGAGPVRLILHRGATIAEDKAATPTFAGDPTGLLTWHSDIRASLTLPPAERADEVRDEIIAVLRAWLDA